MKRTGKITVIAAALLIAGIIPVEAQRGMRSADDTTRIRRSGRYMDMDQIRPMRQIPDSVRMGMTGRGMGPYWHFPGRDLRNFPGYGMRGYLPVPPVPYGRGQFWMDRVHPGRDRLGRPPVEEKSIERPPVGRRGIDRPDRERMPELTDKQREEINSLRQKQMEEMRKFREEHLQKMENLREEHRKRMLDVLTPEQRKLFEPRTAPR